MPELYEILAKAGIKVTGPLTVTVPTGAWTLLPFDTEMITRGSAASVDTANSAVNINEDGKYGVLIMVNAGFDRQEELNLTFQINGTPTSDYLSEQGRATNKPVDFSWYGIVDLVAGDVIQAVLRMEATETDVNVLSANMVVSKEE